MWQRREASGEGWEALVGEEFVVVADDAIALVGKAATGVEGVVVGGANGVFAAVPGPLTGVPRLGEALRGAFGIGFGVEAGIAHAVAVALVVELEEANGVTAIADGVRVAAAFGEHHGL